MDGFGTDLARLRAALEKGPLYGKAERILDWVRPCLWVARELVPDADLPQGASKFGGEPDLPGDSEWPKFEGAPLAFLAQIDLSQVAAFDLDDALPPDGLLAFFYDLERQPWGDAAERDGWRVAWFPPGADLGRRTLPDEPLPACRLTFVKYASLPDRDSALVDDLGLTDLEGDAYLDLLQELSGPSPEHHFLGYSNAIQNDVPLNIEIAANGPIADWRGSEGAQRTEDSKAWRLLFQFDSDDEIGTSWGDAGMLYFCLREDDLREGAFERTWMTLQCY